MQNIFVKPKIYLCFNYSNDCIKQILCFIRCYNCYNEIKTRFSTICLVLLKSFVASLHFRVLNYLWRLYLFIFCCMHLLNNKNAGVNKTLYWVARCKIKTTALFYIETHQLKTLLQCDLREQTGDVLDLWERIYRQICNKGLLHKAGN